LKKVLLSLARAALDFLVIYLIPTVLLSSLSIPYQFSATALPIAIIVAALGGVSMYLKGKTSCFAANGLRSAFFSLYLFVVLSGGVITLAMKSVLVTINMLPLLIVIIFPELLNTVYNFARWLVLTRKKE